MEISGGVRHTAVHGAPAVLTVARLGVCLRDGDATRWIFRDMGFAARGGEVVAVCGPSGSGKSTLLNLLGGLGSPDEGSICVAVEAGGKRVALRVHELSEAERVRYRREHVGFIFQFFNLLPTLTVEENVLLPRRLNGLGGGSEQALRRLEPLGLGNLGGRFPDSLSGGEQQRVAIARALSHAPPLVLADEPTGNLDAANADRVVECLWDQVRNTGAALVIATHNERIAEQADRVVALR
ncbi:MAG: ABC transporter ATP-binding protein [Gammaproteobacteria bacterium]|nr:ABC transporter ATP-binding protein [Gammaproteobacteria bacterium]